MGKSIVVAKRKFLTEDHNMNRPTDSIIADLIIAWEKLDEEMYLDDEEIDDYEVCDD